MNSNSSNNYSNNVPPSLTPNSFASAATSKNGGTLGGDNKISSAEFLSMLKKPTATSPTQTTSTSINPSTTTTTKPLVPSIPFKDDDFGLEGLVSLIKACQSSDRNIFALGVDLEREIGLPMNRDEPIRDAFISPWYDEELNEEGDVMSSDGRKSSPESQYQSRGVTNLLGLDASKNSSLFPTSDSQNSMIPSCFRVASLPASVTKIASFADETLFYIFYAMPGDRMQELAARELFVRGWRFYKPTKSWISCCAAGDSTSAAFKAAINCPTNFFIFEQGTWIKVKRAMTLKTGDLEDSRPITSGTASPLGSPEIMHGSGTLQSTSVTH